MSFGLGKDTPTQSDADNKLQMFKEEFNKNNNQFVKKREETLAQIKSSHAPSRKAKTPIRISNADIEDTRKAINQSVVHESINNSFYEEVQASQLSVSTYQRHKTPAPTVRPI